MIKYTVKSGEMECVIEAAGEADAELLAVRALQEKKPEKLGRIIVVYGGQYGSGQRDDNCMFLSTTWLLARAGYMPETE